MTSETPNIEIFNLAEGEILGVLYQKFPSPCLLNSLEIGGLVEEYYEKDISRDLDAGDQVNIVSKDTIKWLMASGYICYSSESA
jgi:hypothetical protein